jgi:hypothetical protein
MPSELLSAEPGYLRKEGTTQIRLLNRLVVPSHSMYVAVIGSIRLQLKDRILLSRSQVNG